MTDKQDPIAHAARLLREAAEELRQAHTYPRSEDWGRETDAKAAYDEHMAAAHALEDWEAAVGAGGVQALSAAPAVDIAAVGEMQAFEAWYKQDCVIEGAAAKKAAKAAWEARAMLAASPTPPALSAVPAVPEASLVDAFLKWCAALGLPTDKIPNSTGKAPNGGIFSDPRTRAAWGWETSADRFVAIRRMLAASPPAEQQAAPEAAQTWPSEALVWEALQAYLKHDTNMEGMRAALIVGAAPQQAAPKAAPGELHDHQILAITTAYEQGVGKGRQAHSSGKEIANPYGTGYRCDLAWQYGYKEGKEQAERIAKAATVKACVCGEPQAPGTVHRVDGPCYVAAPQQEARHLTQALTDPENQPNQYGVEFGMSGQQMHFKIGNQLFRLAYEPDDQQEFEFMKRMLIHAFSTFTPDVKAAPQPAPQGETNAQLDTDSNSPTPGQQRDVAGPVAVGQPVGHGSDSKAGDPSAQRNKLLTVAERNIRSFLRSAVFKSESDREAALNCVDVLWEAARAPADSGAAPAATVIKKGVDRQWMSERLGHLPDGIYSLYLAPQQAAQEPFQNRVQPWLLQCFGAEIAADTVERNHRFLEEALELVQSTGCTQSEARQLVDYVFGRPVGEPAQEVGGVMVTLAALCLANGLDMHNAGEIELARIWTKVEAIRAKQAAKPKHSPLPQAAPQQEAQDAAFEAVRKKLCALPRFSFLSDGFGVRRVLDKSGSWIAFDAAHELFDPVAVDAALAAQGGKA